MRKSDAARFSGEHSMSSSVLGIDVSKAKLDLALLSEQGKYRSKVLVNSNTGFLALQQWLQAHVPEGPTGVHVCMEATGPYHEALALFLHDLGVCISVVNPLRVKRFIELEGTRNKTDSSDARSLARFCQMTRPEPWEAPSPGVRALQALVARLDALQEMQQSESNRMALAHPAVQASLREVLQTLERAIEDVKAQIRRTIDDDPDLRQRAELLQTIPGLGERTIPQLLAYIGRPERFRNVKALIAYASLSPMIRQSGTSLNKRSGTHPQGHRQLKHALYFPAMVAGRYNPAIAAFWQRLKAQNKPGKVIVVACMHKLLAIVYGVLKSRTPFDATRFSRITA
jgi:transposase